MGLASGALPRAGAARARAGPWRAGGSPRRSVRRRGRARAAAPRWPGAGAGRRRATSCRSRSSLRPDRRPAAGAETRPHPSPPTRCPRKSAVTDPRPAMPPCRTRPLMPRAGSRRRGIRPGRSVAAPPWRRGADRAAGRRPRSRPCSADSRPCPRHPPRRRLRVPSPALSGGPAAGAVATNFPAPVVTRNAAAQDLIGGGSSGGGSGSGSASGMSLSSSPATLTGPNRVPENPSSLPATPLGNAQASFSFPYFQLYTLDQYNGVVLYPGQYQQATLGGSVSLIAQVAASSSSTYTYSWDTSNLTTYRLAYRSDDRQPAIHLGVQQQHRPARGRAADLDGDQRQQPAGEPDL